MSDIGDLLKEIRGKDSLREASKKTGLSHNYISIIEKGVDPRSGSPIKPSPDTLRAYEKGYQVSYERLMTVAGYLSEDGQVKDTRDAAEKLIEYLELGFTDEQIKERMDFLADIFTLNDEQMKEFMTWAREQRAKKTPLRASASKPQDL